MDKEPVFSSKRTWVAVATIIGTMAVLLLENFFPNVVDTETAQTLGQAIGLVGTAWILGRSYRNSSSSG